MREDILTFQPVEWCEVDLRRESLYLVVRLRTTGCPVERFILDEVSLGIRDVSTTFDTVVLRNVVVTGGGAQILHVTTIVTVT